MPGFNTRGQTALHVGAAIDAALVARQAATPPRACVGGSRSGQRMSHRVARALRACDAGDLLPRVAASADFHGCRFRRWAKRCRGLPA